MSFSTLFEPESVVVIGASRNETKVGYAVLKNVIDAGFPGRIYPVNRKADAVLGLKCYPTVRDIPDPVDLAVFVVPPQHIVPMFDECSDRNVSAAIVITAGFKEAGLDGARLERELKGRAAALGIRVVGPNCLGVISTRAKLNATFAAGTPAAGNIAFFSQSGALCTAILDWAIGEGIGFSKFVSLGNKMDIDEVDMLDALAEDEQTTVILGYIEGVKNGQKFMEAARRVSPNTPVIIVKSGGTEAGARAASSHTGTLAGSDKAFDAAFTQSGVVRATTIEELFDYAAAFAYQPLPQGDGLAIVTNAGGPGIIAADAVERGSARVASLGKTTVERLRDNLPPTAAVYNPVDVIGDATADRYEVALTTVLADENVHGALVILTPQAMTDPAATAETLVETVRRAGLRKTVITSFMGGARVESARKILREARIPNFPYPERAVAAFGAMCRQLDWRNRPEPVYRTFDVEQEKARSVLDASRTAGRLNLGDFEVLDIVRAYGFVVPKSDLATSGENAVEVAELIGYPVVMKIASPDILHKSDVGGVRVGVETPDQVQEAFHDMTLRARRSVRNANIWGVSVQEMVDIDKEVILGMMHDPQFGPLVMFGLGGIYVEVLKDVSFRVAPLSEADARAMVESIRSYALLRGVRGEPPVNIDSIVDGLLKLSQLVTDFPEIVELDINPLAVFPEGRDPVAIDARITISEGG